MTDFQVYSWGMCYTSVCSRLTEAKTKDRLNVVMPSGTSKGWIKADETFKTGESNPCPCNNNPKTHKHFLFSC